MEGIAGGVVVWRFAANRSVSEDAEHRAQRLIALSFFLIAAYLAVDATRSLIAADHPDVSIVGIVLAAVTAVAMPPVARAKARVGAQLSSSTASEGRQNMVCAYLSVGLLLGLELMLSGARGGSTQLWLWALPASLSKRGESHGAVTLVVTIR